MNKQTYQSKKDAWTLKCLTAKALTQPRETHPTGGLTNVVRFDSKPFIVKCAIEHNELMETLKTYQLN